MTDNQRDMIADAYIAGGYPAAKIVAQSCGVSPRYIAKLLRKRGIPNTSRSTVGKCPQRRNTSMDPRWSRAIAIGQVSL
jgi:hypothetical protein